MTVAELVRSMAAAGAPSEAIALAVEAIEERDRADAARRAERAAARKRQRMSRDMVATVARHDSDDAATVADAVSPKVSPKDNNQTPNLTPSETTDGGCKAHRMPRGYRLTEDDRQFARDAGWSEGEIDDGETELVDYWSNPKLPASKALKTNWSSVWRNRVRDMGRRRGRQPGGQARGSPQPTQTAIWMKTVADIGGDHGKRNHHEPEILPPERSSGVDRPRGPLHERDRSDPWDTEQLLDRGNVRAFAR